MPSCQSRRGDPNPGRRLERSRFAGEPLEFDAVIECFPPPVFREENPRYGGWLEFTLGEACLVRHCEGKLHLLLTSVPVPPFSSGLLTVAGVGIADFRIIVAKGVFGPLGAFGEDCPTAIWANTPGLTSADLTRFPYAKRRRPMEPFEEVVSLNMEQALERTF